MDKETAILSITKEIFTARMNIKYHLWMATLNGRIDRIYRVLGAVAGSAAVASFGLWKTSEIGMWVWAGLTGVVAVTNAIAAVIPPSRSEMKNTELSQMWTDLRYSLEEFNRELSTLETNLTTDQVNKLDRLFNKKKNIELQQRSPSKRRLEKAYKEVMQEIGEGT